MAGQAPGFLVCFPAAQAAARNVGMGFVVGDEHILTCAHVVNAALGRDLFRQDKPDPNEIVTLRLPMSGGGIREARVAAWLPPRRNGIDGGDIAGLVITGEPLPAGLKPARLSPGTLSVNQVRLFGFPAEAHRLAGDWVSYRLRSGVGDRLLRLKSDSGEAWRAQSGYSGAPVLDQESSVVVGMFKAVSGDERYPDSYAIGATTLREAWDEVLDVPSQSPYKALVAFDEEDHDLFVGRTEDVARLRRAVRRSPFVLVIGPAGVGKSSLVQAGLLPALRKRGLWTAARCRPRSMPFQELAAALFRAEGVSPGAEALRQRAAEIRSGGLADLAATVRIALGRCLLVVVDQLEELFTAGHEPAVVEEFLEVILSLPNTQQGVTVVATVRADFYDRLLAHPDAAARLDGRLVSLSPPGAAALRRVVQEPAGRLGVEFAPGLVDRIVRDACAETSALPLIGCTLSELWPRQRGRVLTHEAYEEIGGLAGSLRTQAEATITTLLEQGTSAATLRCALLALISRIGDRMPTRRGCPVTELPPDQQAVIDALAQARLVTTDTDRVGRRVAELAHEFLLHAWPRLVQLVEDDAAFLRWRGEVEQWRAKGHGLLPDSMIAEARRWCEERPKETGSIRDLVERSEAKQPLWVRQQARDAPRLTAALGGALVLAAGLTASRRPADLVLDATVGADRTVQVFDAISGAEPAGYESSTVIKAVETEPVDVSVESRLRWLHRRSGLTWDQIARLFGVSRRAVHSWVAGGRINAANSEHLGLIVRVLQQLPHGTPERTRQLLMSSSGGAPSLFDRLRSKKVSGIAVEDTLSVRELLGIQEQAED